MHHARTYATHKVTYNKKNYIRYVQNLLYFCDRIFQICSDFTFTVKFHLRIVRKDYDRLSTEQALNYKTFMAELRYC